MATTKPNKTSSGRCGKTADCGKTRSKSGSSATAKAAQTKSTSTTGKAKSKRTGTKKTVNCD